MINLLCLLFGVIAKWSTDDGTPYGPARPALNAKSSLKCGVVSLHDVNIINVIWLACVLYEKVKRKCVHFYIVDHHYQTCIALCMLFTIMKL